MAYEDGCWWWLRSPGSAGYFTACVEDAGTVALNGLTNRSHYYAVRPAMWIALN